MLTEVAGAGAPLMQAVLRYSQLLFTQMAQLSARGRHHALDEQLCRWLLSRLDRVGGSETVATQERTALGLGVRRDGVTEGALRLQKAGLISYSRGRVAVLDRSGLEARSCECHAVLRHAHERVSSMSACTGQPGARGAAQPAAMVLAA